MERKINTMSESDVRKERYKEKKDKEKKSELRFVGEKWRKMIYVV